MFHEAFFYSRGKEHNGCTERVGFIEWREVFKRVYCLEQKKPSLGEGQKGLSGG